MFPGKLSMRGPKRSRIFFDALNHARAASAAWWEDQARTTATTGEGNASVVIFALKNRVADEWRDKQEVDHTTGGEKIAPQRIIIEAATRNDNSDDTPTA